MTKRRNLSLLKAHETNLRRISLVREAIGVLLLCLGFFLLLTLISHNPEDPSFNYANGGKVIQNLTGKTGAYLSDALFQAFGYASGWLVIFLIVPGIKLLRQTDEEEFYLDRILTFPTLALVTTILISLLGGSSLSPDAFPSTGPGGVLGYTIALAMQNTFGVVGTLLLLAPVLLLALMVLSRFSISGMIRYFNTDLDEVNLPRPSVLPNPKTVLHSGKTVFSKTSQFIGQLLSSLVGVVALLPVLLNKFSQKQAEKIKASSPLSDQSPHGFTSQFTQSDALSPYASSERKEPTIDVPVVAPPEPLVKPTEEPKVRTPFSIPQEPAAKPTEEPKVRTPFSIPQEPVAKPTEAPKAPPPPPQPATASPPIDQWRPVPPSSDVVMPIEKAVPVEAKPIFTPPTFPNPFSPASSWGQAPAAHQEKEEEAEDDKDDGDMAWTPPPPARPAGTSFLPPLVKPVMVSTPQDDDDELEPDLELNFDPLPGEVDAPDDLLDEDEEDAFASMDPPLDEPLTPLPPMSILGLPEDTGYQGPSQEELTSTARLLEQKLEDFKIKGQIIDAHPGPVITTYELDPAPGLRAAKVIGLADDLARSISAVSVRVVGNIPGKNVIGIEIPNQNRRTVYLREMLDSDAFRQVNLKSPLAMALGSDINGRPVIGNLAKMPHLLVAGTTGSGKSVAVNAMICSILFTARAEDVRFLMVDPKMLELSIYEGIPHLLAPVVTDVNKAATLLKWAVSEMEERYRLMSEMGVRNLSGYNQRIAECLLSGEEPTRRVKVGFDPETGRPVEQEEPIPLEKKPLIVIIIDELADLMIQVGKDVEPAIARLAQMARAAGLHLIIATQRPSVDVITGLIKANFPTRLAFQVSSKIDSRTILDSMGADRLLGMGDGLFQPPGTTHLQRIHAPFVSDSEVHKLVRFLKSTGRPEYDPSILAQAFGEDGEDGGVADAMAEEYDPLYDQAVAVVVRARKVSTSMVQRHFKIGYNRAARIVERMALDGLISEPNHAGKREVLTPNPMNR